MAAEFVTSSRAEADLTIQYYWYLKEAGEEVANRYLDAFEKTCEKIASHSELGRKRNFRSKELKCILSLAIIRPYQKHLIFFRNVDGQLLVERVIHRSRDLPRRLIEPPEEI